MLALQLEALLLTYLASAKTLWVAYSGGVDSHVLLQLFATLSHSGTTVKAVHVHHGLSPHADHWQQHCQHVCTDLGIPLQVLKVAAQPSAGQSPEAAAREARYQALSCLLQPGDCVATAHHQDDQAETLLLQLCRGAGVKGLAAMPSVAPLAAGQLIRPLLTISRAEIVAYAQQQQLRWIDDESNDSQRFDRNYLRHEIMPLLKKRWPAINAVLNRTAKHCAQTMRLLADLAQIDLITVQSSAPNSLAIEKLKQLTPTRMQNVLRYWLHKLSLPTPSDQQLQQLITSVIFAAPAANPKLVWAQVTVRRYRDKLYAYSEAADVPSLTETIWDEKQPISLPQQLGIVSCELQQGQGIKPEIFARPLKIKFRQLGERCHPVGRQGSHPLKKLFQEWGIPPWQRHSIPLLYADEQLVAVIGYCVCHAFAVNNHEQGWVVKFEPSTKTSGHLI